VVPIHVTVDNSAVTIVIQMFEYHHHYLHTIIHHVTVLYRNQSYILMKIDNTTQQPHTGIHRNVRETAPCLNYYKTNVHCTISAVHPRGKNNKHMTKVKPSAHLT